jgi:hypothetical protein
MISLGEADEKQSTCVIPVLNPGTSDSTQVWRRARQDDKYREVNSVRILRGFDLWVVAARPLRRGIVVEPSILVERIVVRLAREEQAERDPVRWDNGLSMFFVAEDSLDRSMRS